MSEVKQKLIAMINELNDEQCKKIIRHIEDLYEDEKMTPEECGRQMQLAMDMIAEHMSRAMQQAKANSM